MKYFQSSQRITFKNSIQAIKKRRNLQTILDHSHRKFNRRQQTQLSFKVRNFVKIKCQQFLNNNLILIPQIFHKIKLNKQKNSILTIEKMLTKGKKQGKEDKQTQSPLIDKKRVKAKFCTIGKVQKGDHKHKIESSNVKTCKTILKQGKVQKNNNMLFFSWNQRYLVLTNQKLFLFENENKEKIMQCINLKNLPVKVSASEKIKLSFDFMGEFERIELKFQSHSQRQIWKNEIQNVIQSKKKEIKIIFKQQYKHLYNTKQNCMQKQFLAQAQTGDLVLFRTNNTGAKLQRFFTNSEYDHVAMVIKFNKKQAMLFECNGINGVCIFLWDQYIKYFNLYEKVAFRKLSYLRKSELHHGLVQFAKMTVGKKYDISPVKFVTMTSEIKQNISDNDKQEKQDETSKKQSRQQEKEGEERGYFCSQLIAKAYKQVGLLQSNKFCGRYWPVDFCQNQQIDFKKGISLGDQKTIILNKHIENLF